MPSDIAGFTQPSTLSRSTGIPLTWTPGDANEVWTWIITCPGGLEAQRLLFCRSQDTGFFEVPAAAMALLPEHPEALLVHWRVTVSEVIAGNARVNLWAAQANAMPQPIDLLP